MIRTIEAVIDEEGNVRLLEPAHLPSARRALLTILEDQPAPGTPECALLSETALAENWNRPEEDEAWSHLNLVIDPKPRPRYTLAELLAASDYSQPQPAEEREWVDAPAVGGELL